jgi:hypothetical protein
MTAKILPLAILLVALGLFAIFLIDAGQGGELGALATAAETQSEIDQAAPAGLSVAPEEQFNERRLLEGVQIQVWENRLFVASSEPLEVFVALYEKDQPLQNREPILYLTRPDGGKDIFYFPPTQEDGQTNMLLPPIDAPNGALIAYEVCLQVLGGANRCVGENYLIWDYQ